MADGPWLVAVMALPARGATEVDVSGLRANHTEVLGPPFLPIRHSAESRAVGEVLSFRRQGVKAGELRCGRARGRANPQILPLRLYAGYASFAKKKDFFF